MKINFVFLIILSIFGQSIPKAPVDFFAKSVKYSFNKTYASDVRCGFRTTRQFRGGLVNCQGYLNVPIYGFFVQVIVFYKYGTVYRQYLINYPALEPCKMIKKYPPIEYRNPLSQLVIKSVKDNLPIFRHECPYMPGFYGGINIDVNATMVPYLPPVVPAGTFKYV